MKKFFENSKLAKIILMDGYIAITLGPWAFNKKPTIKNVKIMNALI